MTDFSPLAGVSDTPVATASQRKDSDVLKVGRNSSSAQLPDAELPVNANITRESIVNAAETVESVVKSVTAETALTFRVEEGLSRMVVAVRAVGSDEIIRQFPPEEFITVAKFIAAQDPQMIDEDYLKGILFDQYT